MKNLRRWIERLEAARRTNLGDELAIQVSGFEFQESNTELEIAEAKGALSLGILSDTFEREVKKWFARSYLKDIDEDKWNLIESEIEAAPSQQQVEEQAAAAAKQTVQQSLLNGLAPPVMGQPQ